MQGISKAKHEHLVGALLQLEMLLKEQKDEQTALQAEIYKQELAKIKNDYDYLLIEVAERVQAYLTLYEQAKFKFLSVKLRELRKEIPDTAPVFGLLRQNIQLAYGT